MLDNRRHFRLRHYVDVNWSVQGQQDAGEGLVLNLSSSGMLLQTDKVFKSSDHCVMSIKFARGEDQPFAQKKGKVVWVRRIRTPQERYQCGVQFIDPEGDVPFLKWIEGQITRLGDAADVKVVSNLIG